MNKPIDKPAVPTGLELLRAPFPPNQISKLPKPTKKQTEALNADFKTGIRCKLCGGWHHKDVVHLDYVGHAALTDRLLDCDIEWNWDPVVVDSGGAPMLDPNGGMWIRLTVCGLSRLGYGHADGKKGGDAIKEVIGDALRNAAMRFGAALDLWHKGDLHGDEQTEADTKPPSDVIDEISAFTAAINSAVISLETADDGEALRRIWSGLRRDVQADAKVIKAKDDRKVALSKPTADEFDDIPYDMERVA